MRKTSIAVNSSKPAARPSLARQRLLLALLAFSSLTSGGTALAAGGALPTGGHFVGGSGAITQGGNHLTVNQSSQLGIINWQSFSIGKGNSVAINNGKGATLNRVTGADMSTIAGSLKSTGSVYIVNQAGVLVTSGGRVTTNGTFVASSRDVSNSAFMAGGKMVASGDSSGTVENQGTITSNNGDVVLVGKSVSNSGTISAANGSATLAAGDKVLLQASGDDAVLVNAGSGDVTNTGTVQAAQVALNAKGGNVYALAVNDGGVIRATGTATKDGRVYLTAGDDVTVNAATVTATNANGSGGRVEVTGQTVSIGAKTRISANGAGKAAGGTVLIGGDRHGGQDRSDALSKTAIANAQTTNIAATATISADGGGSGNGGNVVIWSNETTNFAGHISAKGGASGGDGGQVEVSSEGLLGFTGNVSTLARRGKTGMLLIDPSDVTIYSSTDNTHPTPSSSFILNTTIDTMLASNNVTINTSGTGGSGDIHLGTAGGTGGSNAAPIFWSSGNSLTLSADRLIDMPGGNPSTSTGGANLGNGGADAGILINSLGSGALTLTAAGTGLPAAATVISITGNIAAHGGTISFISSSGTYRIEGGNGQTVSNTTDNGAGKIVFQADQVRLGTGSGPTTTVTTPGEVDIVPTTAGAVQVGDIDTGGAFFNDDNTTLFRSEDVVNVTANLLVIGSTSTTSLSFVTANPTAETNGTNNGFSVFDAAFVNNLKLVTSSSGTVTQDAATGIIVNDAAGSLASGAGGLAIQTGTVALNSKFNSVGSIAFNTTGGNISFAVAPSPDNTLVVGTVAGISGITTSGGTHTVTLAVDSDTVTQSSGAANAIAPTSGTLNLELTTPSGGTASSFTLDNPANKVTTVGANVSDLTLYSNVNLSTGTVGSTTGVSGTGDIKIVDNGQLTIGSGAGIATTGGNIQVEDQTFVNSDAGNAFSAGSGKTWRVYSQDPTLDSANTAALSYSFVQYNAANSYGTPFSTADAALNVAATGNGFLFTTAPTASVTASGTFNKTYDGTNAVTQTIGNSIYGTPSGLINNDQAVLTALSDTNATYSTKNAGTNLTITLSQTPGFASFKDSNNVAVYGYQTSVTTTVKGTISPLDVTVSGSRTYDGTTGASGTILTVSGEIGGDPVLTVTGSGSVANKNVGTSKSITNLGTLALSGTGAGNYNIASGTLTITPLDVTVTGSRVYDATATASGSDLAVVGEIVGDPTLTVTGSGSVANKNVGNSKTISNLGTLALSGTGAGNYNLVSGTLTITPLGLTLTGTRTYDGTTTADSSILTLNGELGGDGVLTLTGSGSVANKNVGTSKTITDVSGYGLTGTNAGNYSIASGTLTITPLDVTVTGSRSYDGTTGAAGTVLTVSGEIGGDPTLTVTGSGSVGNKNVGNSKSITNLGTLALSGTGAGNYNIASGTLTITPLDVTVTGSRTYDGTTTTDNSYLSVVGVISGDPTLTVTGSGSVANKNAGTSKNISNLGTLALSGTGASNYNLASGTLTITPLDVTVTGSRTYDGTTGAAGTILTVSGEIGGDPTLTVTGSGSVGNKNVGTSKSISSLGTLALSGTGAGNYNIASGTLTITPLDVTVTGSRTYDGTTTASGGILAVVGEITGDGALTVTGSGSVANKNVGNSKSITDVSGYGLTGTNAGNYNIVSGTLTITPLGLTVTGSRTYDGTTTADSSVLTLNGELVGDGTLTLTGSGSVGNKNVGTSKTITDVSGYGLTGANAGNYSIASGTLTITPLDVTVTGTRTYDGTTGAAGTILTVVGEIGGDPALTVTGSGSVGNKNVGTSKTISNLGTLALSGTGAGNYNLASGTLTITPLDVTVTGTRTYDGTTGASGTILSVVGEIGGDPALTVTGSGSVGNKNAGTSKNISNLGTLALSGTGAGNYNLASGTLTITPLDVTVVGTRTYDGTAGASGTILTVVGEIGGDPALTVTGSGSVGNKNAGTSKTITNLGTLALSGTGAGNYSIASGTLTITPLDVTVVGSRTYDGTTGASGTILSVVGEIGGDPALTVTGSGSVGNKNVGNSKSITNLGTLALSGTGAGNYNIASGTLTITPLDVTVTGTRSYDGTTGAAGTILTVNGEIVGDPTLTVTGSGTLASKNASSTPTNISNLGSLALTGTGASNYNLVSGTVTVTPLGVTVTGTRAYDTTKNAPGNILSVVGEISGDPALTVTGNGMVADPNAGSNKNITNLGTLALSGSGSGNYQIISGTLTITPADVTVVGFNGTRVYDGMTDANSSILTLTGIMGGDQVGITGTGVLASKNVGKETVTGIGTLALTGADKNNYQIVVGRPDTYVIVTPATLTINAVTQTKVFDGTAISNMTPTVAGLQTGDSIIGTLTQVYDSRNVQGTNKSTLSVNNFTGVNDGNGGNNYTVVINTAKGTITPESIVISAVTDTKVYDGTTTSTGTPTLTDGTLYNGDTLTGLAQAFNSKDVLGTNKSTLTIGAGYTLTNAGNYSVTLKTAKGTITPLAIDATGTRVYDGTPDVDGSILTITNLVGGDTVGITGTGTSSSPHVGTHDITGGDLVLTGPDAHNYTLTGGSETVKITPFAVILTGTRVYDGETDGDSGILSVTNAFAGDQVLVTSGTSTIISKNVGDEKITDFGTLTLGGTSAGDYTLVGAKGNVIVTPEQITVTAVPGTKTYDGTTTSDGTPIVTTGTIFTGDNGNFIQTYGSQHAGNNVTLTPSGSVNDGNGGKNYIVTYVPITDGIINPLPVNLTGTRPFDNGTDANSGILTITNLVPGDSVAVGGTAGTVISPNVGPETITDFTGLTLGGPSAGDYTLVGATGVVNITPASTPSNPNNQIDNQTASGKGAQFSVASSGIITIQPQQNGVVTGTIATIDGTDYHPDSQLGCTLGAAGCIQNGVAPSNTGAPQ